MKKTILLPLAIFFLSAIATAQTDGYWYNENWVQLWERSSVNEDAREKIKASKIKEEKVYITKKKGEVLTLSRAITYDEKGRITSANKKHWNRNKYRVHKYHYNKEDLVSKVEKTNLKGQANIVIQYQYNKDKLLTLFSQASIKKGITKKIESGYNGELLIWRKSYFKGKSSPFQNWTYEYHEDDSRKETKYFKKGNLKYTFHYDCKPEGEVQGAKHKDTSMICIKKEIDKDGNTVKYIQTTNDKNEVVTNRTVYSPDKKIISRSSKGKDGELKYWWERKGDTRHYKSYKKGKLIFERISVYNSDENKTEYSYINHKKSKWSYKITFEYDSKGLLTKEIRYNNKGKTRSISNFMREFYN